MTKSTYLQLRLIAFHRQNCQCFYCELPIWEGSVEPFAARYGISIAQAKELKSTAEHRIPRKDGGLDTLENIVAACAWCNRRRHAGRPHKAPDPLTYKCRVARRMAMGKWHPTGLAAVMPKFDVMEQPMAQPIVSIRSSALSTSTPSQPTLVRGDKTGTVTQSNDEKRGQNGDSAGTVGDNSEIPKNRHLL